MLTLCVLLLAGSLNQSCIPVIGKWRGSSSTLVLANSVARPSRVTLSWIVGSPRDFSPPDFELMLHGHETRRIDVGAELLHGREAAGAIRITADAEIAAHAIVLARENGAAASIAAVPARNAIGTGQTATLGGVIGAAGYRLFAAEMKGHPIYFSATVFVGEEERGQRRYYIEPRHQASLPIDRHFGLKPGQPFTIILRALNGSGLLVAAGGEVTATHDIITSQMLPPPHPRHRMMWPEGITYGAAALALAVAAIYGAKSRPSALGLRPWRRVDPSGPSAQGLGPRA